MTLNSLLDAIQARVDAHKAQPRERGAVLALVAATLVVILISGAMAVDLSAVSTRGQHLQNAADAAALAGVEVWVDTGNQAAATAVVNDILHQNGIGSGDSTTATIGFPSATEMSVVLTDSDPDVMLSGVVGVGTDVAREAAARFLQCAADCSYEVLIPAPFSSVNAAGSGDGYKPIPVGDRLYAINHNTSSGKIVCVDRITEQKCWSTTSRDAYSGGARYNPEMPQTAVFGTRIFWSVSDTTGHRLYCFETATGTPCTTNWLLADTPRATSTQISNSKDQNRGGGTVLVGNKIYDFTDNHEVHCFDPVINTYCGAYPKAYGGANTGLGQFPDNQPSDGNHGSSIDRAVDETTGKIYSTIHINTAVSTTIDCVNSLTAPEGKTVVIKNVSTGSFITAAASSQVVRGTVGTANAAKWFVGDESGTNITFTNIGYSGQVMYSTGKSNPVDTRSSVNAQAIYRVSFSGGSTTLRNDDNSGWVYDTNVDIEQHKNDQGTKGLWKILPWQCGDPLYVPPAPPTLPYAAGTWLHCFDTVLVMPCAGFTPSRIHTNADRFSGRLFFFYAPTLSNGTHLIQGVCSTGYNGSVSTVSNLEIKCVNNVTGVVNAAQSSNLATLRSNIVSATGSSPAAWGEPHWNEEENRLFYPTEHTASRSKVLCWDFDTGWCGSRQGYAPTLGQTEDYGFFSEGNCVYGLGHTAYFWAFHAEDINSKCTGSSTSTTITPCDCSGTLAWGTLEFDVDIDLFDVFDVVLVDADGNKVYPTDRPTHSLKTDGTTIYLGDIPTTYPSLTVLVTVEAENDPWAHGVQTFVIQFQRAPHLIN